VDAGVPPSREPREESSPGRGRPEPGEDLFTPFPAVPWLVPRDWPFPPGGLAVWAPRVDVVDRGDSVVVRAEVPGMSLQDIRVRADAASVIIEGERHRDTTVRGEMYYRRECSYGRFRRQVSLPVAVEPDSLEVHYRDGVLTLVLRKAASGP